MTHMLTSRRHHLKRVSMCGNLPSILRTVTREDILKIIKKSGPAHGTYARPVNELPDSEGFKTWSDQITQSVDDLNVEDWVERARAFRLDEKVINFILRSGERYFFENHNLTQHIFVKSHSTGACVILFPSTKEYDDEWIKVQDRVDKYTRPHPTALISTPMAEHGILFQDRNLPRFVDNHLDSPFAVVVYNRHDVGHVDPEFHFNSVLKTKLVSFRFLNKAEKLHLAERTRNKSLRNKKLCLLEFVDTSEKSQKMEVISQENKVNYLFSPNMVDPQRVFKTYLLQLKYKISWTSETEANISSVIQQDVLQVVSELEKQRRTPYLPENGYGWDIIEEPAADQRVRNFQVEIEDSWPHRAADIIGAVLDDVVNNSEILRIRALDRPGPRLRPVLRCSIAISRAVRIALNPQFIELDNRLRGVFPTILEGQEFNSLRLFEEWEDGCDVGMIGVEGWPISVVERCVNEELRPLLIPIQCPIEEFPDREWKSPLNTEIGRIFIQSLPRKYYGQVIVDIDRHNNTISLLGDKKSDAMEDLRLYTDRKNENYINMDIEIDYPYFNRKLRDYLTEENIRRVRSLLCLTRLQLHERVLHFNGTIKALELLMEWLKKLNDKIFEKFTMVSRNYTETRCSQCTAETPLASKSVQFSCGHWCCEECLHHSAKSNIRNVETTIKCSQVGCIGFLSTRNLMKLFLGNDQRLQHLDIPKLRRLMMDTTKGLLRNHYGICCIWLNCPGIWYRDNRQRISKRCTSCPKHYCSACLDQAHRGPCPDEDETRRVLAEGLRNKQLNVRTCPGCHLVIEKTEACNHMTCVCGAHFCFFCEFQGRDGNEITEHINDVHRGNRVVQPAAPVAVNVVEEEDVNVQRALLEEIEMNQQRAGRHNIH